MQIAFHAILCYNYSIDSGFCPFVRGIALYFAYGETELFYLRKKDKRLSAVIDRIGHIDRKLFKKIPQAVQPLLQCGQPVFLDCGRRGNTGDAGLRVEKAGSL